MCGSSRETRGHQNSICVSNPRAPSNICWHALCGAGEHAGRFPADAPLPTCFVLSLVQTCLISLDAPALVRCVAVRHRRGNRLPNVRKKRQPLSSETGKHINLRFRVAAIKSFVKIKRFIRLFLLPLKKVKRQRLIITSVRMTDSKSFC